MIEKLADWLFADAWRQCKAQYEYAVKTFGLNDEQRTVETNH